MMLAPTLWYVVKSNCLQGGLAKALEFSALLVHYLSKIGGGGQSLTKVS